MSKLIPLLLVSCTPLTVEEVLDTAPSDDLTDSAIPEGDTGEEPADTDSTQDSARIHYAAFPDTINCGESAMGHVIVENTGTATWTRDSEYKLGAINDHDPFFDSDDVRVWLQEGESVAPGERYSFEIELIGPDSLGTKRTDWQMVHEGVRWFGEVVEADIVSTCEESDTGGNSTYPLALPDMSDVVREMAEAYPDEFSENCAKEDGNFDWLELLVAKLRESDDRWGFNWKRGVEGDASHDVVDYHFGPGVREGSTDVYIIDVIVDSCGEDPRPGWGDQTQATADAGTVGKWTGRGLF